MNKLVKKLMLVAAMLMLAAGPSFAADAIRIGLMCPVSYTHLTLPTIA